MDHRISSMHYGISKILSTDRIYVFSSINLFLLLLDSLNTETNALITAKTHSQTYLYAL